MSEIVGLQEESSREIERISNEVARENNHDRFFEIKAPIIANFFENHLKKNFKSADILSNPEKLRNDLETAHKAKMAVNSNISVKMSEKCPYSSAEKEGSKELIFT